MKKNVFYSLAVMGLMAAMIGAGTALFFYKTEAQTKQIQTDNGNPVVWKRVELPLKPFDSTFRIDIPAFSSGADYIIGVKPVKDGEKEKMYAGIVTWKEHEKIKGLLMTANIENYPVEAGGFPEGKALFNDVLTTRQTLVIYIEVAPATRLMLNKADGEMTLDSSDGSFIVFNGKREAIKIDRMSALLNQLQMRKAAEGTLTLRKENDQ